MNLEKLKIKMILHYPFFGALLHHMEHIETKRIPTAGTNGNQAYYNAEFMDKLDQNQQLFVMAHELLHAAFLHVGRWQSFKGNGENQMVWNFACDFLINDLLINEQKMTAPKDVLVSEKYKFADWTAEKLYKELMQNAQKMKCAGTAGDGSGACSGNDMMDGDGDKAGETMSEADRSEMERKWKIAVNEAAAIAKKAGNCPASIERLIGELLKPRINWKDAMQDWFSAKIKEASDWCVPNRRFVHQGLYLPSKRTEHVGDIVVAIDTSGSIGEYELNAFGSELNYIFEQVKPTKVHVIYCDCAINRTEEFSPDDFPLKLKPYGGGGTSFRPPFAWVKKHLGGKDIAGFVYMTDMYGDFPDKAPEYPVLWMATSDIKAPFGDTVEYNIERK